MPVEEKTGDDMATPVEEKNITAKQAKPRGADEPVRPVAETHWLYRLICWSFRIFGRVWLRQELIGLENVPLTGPVLVLPTHTSYVDPPLVGSNILRDCHYVSRAGIIKVPLWGWFCLNILNAHPIRRGASDREGIRVCRNVLKAGYSLLIFPEGTRSPNGRLGPIQGGFAMILEGLDVPYVPVMAQSSYRILPKGAFFPWPRKLTIIYGKPSRLPERLEGEKGRDFFKRCIDQLEREYREMGAV